MAPRWSRDGKEIYYVERLRRLMAVPVRAQPDFSPGPPAALFEKSSLRNFYPEYDVSADGKRFVLRERPPGEPPLAIHVVHSWFEEFRGASENKHNDRRCQSRHCGTLASEQVLCRNGRQEVTHATPAGRGLSQSF
jgi:hypothetical protein